VFRGPRVVSLGDVLHRATGRTRRHPDSHLITRPGASFTLLLLAVALLTATALAARPASLKAVPEPADYWNGDINSPTPATVRGGKVIDAKQLSALLKAEKVVVVDVSNAPRRPENLAPGAPWLPLPHAGIPGAVWIPGAGLGVVPVPVDTLFRAHLAASTGGDLSRAIVIYCHQGCWLSWNAAKRAIGYGYHNVSWFPAGIEGWRAKGFPTQELKAAEPPSASPHATHPSPDSSSGPSELAAARRGGAAQRRV
jgi:PQQ-dependent catabolism-associated CXXCW motif protein